MRGRSFVLLRRFSTKVIALWIHVIEKRPFVYIYLRITSLKCKWMSKTGVTQHSLFNCYRRRRKTRRIYVDGMFKESCQLQYFSTFVAMYFSKIELHGGYCLRDYQPIRANYSHWPPSWIFFLCKTFFLKTIQQHISTYLLKYVPQGLFNFSCRRCGACLKVAYHKDKTFWLYNLIYLMNIYRLEANLSFGSHNRFSRTLHSMFMSWLLLKVQKIQHRIHFYLSLRI